MINSIKDSKQLFDDEKWLKIAFPVAVFSIFGSVVIPNIIFLIVHLFDKTPGSFARILLASIPVQLSLLLPVIIATALQTGYFSLEDVKTKVKLVCWKSAYIAEVIKIELIIFLPLCILAFVTYSLLVYFGYDPSSPITTLLESADLYGIGLIFFVSIFIAPVAEEIIFRRVFYSFSVKLMNENSAVIITSFLFASLHGGLVQIIPLTLFGCVLQKLYIKHNSLYPCLLLHGIHNFIMMSFFLASWILT
jgi:membrane protease YdiL (CAAX protease family)